MAVSKKLQREYDRLYKRWEKRHEKYWRKMADKPYIAGTTQNDMSVGQMSALEPTSYRAYGNVLKQRRTSGAEFATDKQLQTAIDQMKRQLSPGYERRRAKSIKENFTRAARVLGNDELTYRIANLSDEQLRMLNDQGDFANVIWRMAYPPDFSAAEDDIDQEFLEYNLDYIEEQYPTKKKKRKRDKLRDLFRKWDIQHDETHQRNIQLARQGEKTLRSFGVAPTLGQGRDWWRAYEKYFPRN